jgi:Ribbon-helix-helix protein, copG family
MRTTLSIDDDLYRRAKAAAALQGSSVTSLIEDALRRALDTPSAPAPVPELPVGRETGGPLPGIDLHDARALAAVLDEGRGIDALR